MAPTIQQEILIVAPVDVVWRTVTEPEQVSVWFSDEVDLEAKPGYEGVLTFNDRGHQAVHERASAREWAGSARWSLIVGHSGARTGDERRRRREAVGSGGRAGSPPPA
jgi:hypothetical protein